MLLRCKYDSASTDNQLAQSGDSDSWFGLRSGIAVPDLDTVVPIRILSSLIWVLRSLIRILWSLIWKLWSLIWIAATAARNLSHCRRARIASQAFLNAVKFAAVIAHRSVDT